MQVLRSLTSEEEVITRRDNHNIVVLSINFLKKGTGAPTRTEDDQGLFVWVLLEL